MWRITFLVFVVLGSSQAGAQISPPVSGYGLLGEPREAFASDFDGDGHLDVAVVDGSPPRLVVFTGDGGGRFNSLSPMSLPGVLWDLKSTDFNLDGFVDLIAIDPVLNRTWIGLGLGDGTFEAAEEINFGGTFGTATVGDFDEDGIVDLVCRRSTAAGEQELLFYRGSGDGTFDLDGTILVSSGFTYDVIKRVYTEDMDADGHLDVVAIVSQGSQLFLGDGTGSFSVQPAVTNFGGSADEGSIVDYDLDGNLDIVIRKDWYLEIQFGAGDGTFPTYTSRFGETHSDERDLVVEDFDLDGDPDVLVIYDELDGTPTLGMFRNEAGGSFAPETFPGWGGATDVVSGDFNEDGWLDVVFPTFDGLAGGITCRFGDGSGSFPAPTMELMSGDPESSETIHLNDDGRPDLVVLTTAGCFATFLNDGAGRLVHDRDFSVGNVHTWRAVDLDDDGREEIVVSRLNSTVIQILNTGPDGVLSFGQNLIFDEFVRLGDAADVDADGTVDLLLIRNSGDQTLLLARGLVGGTYDTGVPIVSGGERAVSVVALDYDRDGTVDLAVGHILSSDITVLRGTGTGEFNRVATTPELIGQSRLHFGDIDGDGREDLIVPRSGSVNEIRVILAGPSANYGFIDSFPSSTAVGPVEIVDWDADGYSDVLVPIGTSGGFPSSSTLDVQFFRGTPSGLEEATALTTGRFTRSVNAVDLDGDCDLELIATRADVVTFFTQDQPVADCDASGVPDACEIADGLLPDCDGNGIPDSCDLASGWLTDADGDGTPDECQGQFRRGDCNGDGAINIADPVFVELYLFVSGAAPGCFAACDSNGDSVINIADSIFILSALFVGGAPPIGLDCVTDLDTPLPCLSSSCP